MAPLEEPGSIYSILFLQKTHARFLERVLEKIEASLAWAEDGFLESEPKPITHHRDDPRWQAAHSEYQALDKRELGKSMDLICLMRDIEKIYENLDARIEAASKILKKSPSSAQIPADERRAIACAMARELV